MHKAQEQVRDFHRACQLPSPEDAPLINWAECFGVRFDLVKEEVTELWEGIYYQKQDDVIDALCDILYVVYGFAVAAGIDLEPYFEEVHSTNMRKAGGERREDGKQLKPEGWIPPDIRTITNQFYGVLALNERKNLNAHDQGISSSRSE